ncbi:MAG: hypothetical protein OXI96_09815 [Acidimicrobiaceae bacterium]|nr:hypothetical protein [Acidimicrobiaceae bacterium]
MNIFTFRDQYQNYSERFVEITDKRIREAMDDALDKKILWPDPRGGLNPLFESGSTINQLVSSGRLHPLAEKIFRKNKSVQANWNEECWELIRAELDALMFHLYGIGRSDTDYIMETFLIVKRKDVKAHGEFLTKRFALERYDAMTEAFESTHGSLAGTSNGTNPPSDRSSLETYSHRIAETLTVNYQTNLYPPPDHLKQTHLMSTGPPWVWLNSSSRN